MKRIIIIAVLLAICAAVSAYAVHHTGNVNDFVSASAERALRAMAEGDEAALRMEIENLSEYWNNEEDYIIHFVRHAQIDDITKSVARLRALTEGENYPELAAELSSIRWQMEHINRSERMIFSNLFCCTGGIQYPL